MIKGKDASALATATFVCRRANVNVRGVAVPVPETLRADLSLACCGLGSR